MNTADISTCAIVGGVLTVASLVDAAIFNSRKRLGKEYDGGAYGGISGKMVSEPRERSEGGEHGSSRAERGAEQSAT